MEARTTIEIKGIIRDIKTGEFLSDANIYLKSDRTNSSFSNSQGRFVLKLPYNENNDVLIITNAGYERFKLKVALVKELNLSVNLSKRKAVKTDRAQQDQELVSIALSNEPRSQQAYGKLMARYRDSIFFMIQKMVNNRDDAEDLTIEAFGKAFQNLYKYSPDYAFSTWLYRIAINNCIDHIRKKRINTLSLDEPKTDDDGSTKASQDPSSRSLDPLEEYIKKQRIIKIRNVIERLSPKYRKLIQLRYLEEKSYHEIAEEMQLPLGTVKAQLYRAKELMYNIMKPDKPKY